MKHYPNMPVTYLTLHKGQTDNTARLFRSRYEVVRFAYRFGKEIGRRGEPASDVQGGLITVVVSGAPTSELLGWMFNIRRTEDGEISTHDPRSEVLDKVYFEHGRLVGLRIVYNASLGDGSASVELTISTPVMMLGETEYRRVK